MPDKPNQTGKPNQTDKPNHIEKPGYAEQKPVSLLHAFGIPVLLCALGIAGAVLFIEQKKHWPSPTSPTGTDWRHIPPEWITHQHDSLFVCPIEGRPTCFTVWPNSNDAGSTFIIGTSNPNALWFFDSTENLLRKMDLPSEPRAIAVGTADTIFTDKIVIAHPTHIALYPTEQGGEPEQNGRNFWRFESGVRIHSLALTPDYLFAADSGNCCIYRLNTDGDLDLTFGEFVVYTAPIAMTYAPRADLLYIANPGKYRVEVFTQSGLSKPELMWGESSSNLDSFIGCCNPVHLSVLEDGGVITVEKSASRIKIYRWDHESGRMTLDGVVAGWDILERFPADLARFPMQPGGRDFSAMPLSDGRIAVFDFNSAVLRVFSPHYALTSRRD